MPMLNNPIHRSTEHNKLGISEIQFFYFLEAYKRNKQNLNGDQ